MKKLSDKEKLDLCIKFIKSLEAVEITKNFCGDLGCINNEHALDEIKDKAWHLLADLA